MDFPTYQDLFRQARNAILAGNGKLTLDVVEREGTDANAFTAAISAVGDTVIGQLARLEASLTSGSAKGKDLDRLVYDQTGLLRIPATPSVGSVQFVTSVPTVGAFTIPAGLRLQTSTGVQFVTTTGASFPAASTGPVTVAVRSTVAGTAAQARAGTITSIVDPIPGQPADLTVSNPLATAGGTDAEKDEPFLARKRLFFSTTRRGTLRAIETLARSIPGVISARALEVLDEYGRPAKAVQLIVADQFTEQFAEEDSVPPAYQTQSQVLSSTVYLALDDTRAAGIFVDVRVAKVVLQRVTLALSFRAGVDLDAVAYQARGRVASYVNGLQPGAALDPADLLPALRGVPGLIVTGAEVLDPIGVVVPNQLEVLRTTMGLVVASTVQPDQRLAGTANPDAVP